MDPSQPLQNSDTTSMALQPRPPRLLRGYQDITLTVGSPLRPYITICPICLGDLTISETLTHSNGTCNRSFHQNCWEPWIADMGTCAICRDRLRGPLGRVVPQAVDPNFHERNGDEISYYREHHNPQDLVGQEFLEYHVNWVMSQIRRRLNRQRSITQLPVPFNEADMLRLWFNRRRAEFNITGVANRWQDLINYQGPQSAVTQLIIAQFQDIRFVFAYLASILPHMYEIRRVYGGLTQAVFGAPPQLGMSRWEEEIVPWLHDETRSEVASVISRWVMAFDQAFWLEDWLDQEEENRERWERLVNTLDRRLDREWRYGRM